MEIVKVLLATGQDELRSAVANSLVNVEYIALTGEAASLEEAVRQAESYVPDVVLIDASVSGDGYKLAEIISGSSPETALVILDSDLQEETMRKAIFSGASDVLIYPFSPAKLIDSIYRSYQSLKKMRQIQNRHFSKQRQKFDMGKLAVVFSTKGGVGKTFLSTNLAVSLLRETGARVVLVDLDLDFGNASLALDIVPRFTISDVVNEIVNLDRELLESFLIRHPSGIALLAANVQPRMNEFISGEHVDLILKLLQSAYDYVIVDMPSRFSSTLDPAFQRSDLLLLITTPEVSTIRNLKACINTLGSLNYSAGKIKLILNKAGLSADIRVKDVEATLGHRLYGLLPVDFKLVTDSLNKGVPVVRLHPRSRTSRGIQALAKKMAGNTPAGSKSARRFRNPKERWA
ncbi:MAG: AAA family ATPase [Bacillota bacterium]